MKKELTEFIKSFNKEPGNFSDDELISIGIEHQKLFQSEKNWDELATALGVSKTGEQFRKWILHKRYAKGLVPKNPKVLDDKTVETATTEDVSNSLTKQKEDLYVEKQKVRDSWNAYRRTLRDEARIQSFQESIIKAISTLPEIKLTNVKTNGNLKSGAEGILLLSDWHIGQEADNFYNKYNKDIAKERVNEVINGCIKYCKDNSVTKLNVLNLGDLVEGIINTNGRIEQETDVTDELMYATELMANALCVLCENIPEVTYRYVVDNHSRLVADKHQSIVKENLCRLSTWYLKERLKNTPIKFIDDNLDIGLGKFKLNNNMNIMFMHGHEDSKDKTLQNVVGATHEWIDIVCCAHWHNPSEHTFQDMKLFINGSLCGTGPYALSKRLFNKPSQKLIIVDNANFIDIDIVVK